jgi:hypothetical protein
MARMTEEEAYALDDYYTKNPPKIDPGKRGGFLPAQVIGELARGEIARQG